MLTVILILLLSYLVGSIPTAIIVSRLVAGIDIRNYGSGNAGGTNVFRVLGWKYGILVMLFDAFKGVVAVVFIARLFFLTEMPFETQRLLMISLLFNFLLEFVLSLAMFSQSLLVFVVGREWLPLLVWQQV